MYPFPPVPILPRIKIVAVFEVRVRLLDFQTLDPVSHPPSLGGSNLLLLWTLTLALEPLFRVVRIRSLIVHLPSVFFDSRLLIRQDTVTSCDKYLWILLMKTK